MSHYAQIDDSGTVLRVLSVDNSVTDGQTFLAVTLGLGGTWVQTSYNTRGGVHCGPDGNPDGGTPLRKNYAGPGFTYDAARDAFIPPKPFPSWSLDEGSCLWQAPVPYPADGKYYLWDEAHQQWVLNGS
jgi:hypothetical protein